MHTTWADNLLKWYRAGHRALPWRGASDPYLIWVSEIMLQQTQVATVLPYYARWQARFPTVAALAAAPEQDVLKVWEGLGYYTRARNMHRAAQKIANELHGQWPHTVEGLRALPGIGPYTAAAIASLAFGVDAAVVDGNVKRVLARAFNIEDAVKAGAGEKKIWALAQALLPLGQAADYNQALMDLGATLCTPRAPTCERCPVNAACEARKLGVQLQRPLRPTRPPVPHKTFAIGVIRKRGRVLLMQRAEKLLGNLWAFPAAEGRDRRALKKILKRDWKLEIEVHAPLPTLTHTFTHFKMTARVFDCQWLSGALPRGTAAKWVRPADLSDYPMGKVDRLIAKQLRGGEK